MIFQNIEDFPKNDDFPKKNFIGHLNKKI